MIDILGKDKAIQVFEYITGFEGIDSSCFTYGIVHDKLTFDDIPDIDVFTKSISVQIGKYIHCVDIFAYSSFYTIEDMDDHSWHLVDEFNFGHEDDFNLDFDVCS